MANRRPPDPQTSLEACIINRQRTGDGDDVVLAQGRRVEDIADLELHPGIGNRAHVGPAHGNEFGMDVDRVRRSAQQRQAGREVAGAAADLEHGLGGIDAESLQYPALSLGANIDWPKPMGMGESANASSRYATGTKASRGTADRTSSTRGSRTSHVRIC